MSSDNDQNTWLSELEKMLHSRNPLQGEVLHPEGIFGPCKGNVFLKNAIHQKNIQIGDYTYAHVDGIEESEILKGLVPYSFGNQNLVIGKFCSIGFGVQFISPILYPKSWTKFLKAFCAYLTYNINNWRSKNKLVKSAK